jgi:type II secretory ATPase GspE/PulE/Tfp pilus assembly ATPase PilB-like protein
MRRLLVVSLTVAAVGALGVQDALAQSPWAAYPIKEGWSGPGFYLNLGKILACWLLFLCWVYTTDWVSRDVQEVKLGFQRWNPIVFGTFMAAFVLVWVVPSFWISYPVLALAYVAPLTTYVILRNRKVPAEERVMTPDHLRFWFAERASKFGMKIKVEKADPQEAGPPVTLTAQGGETERDNTARTLLARQAPGLFDARQLLVDALFRRADGLMLDFTAQNMSVQHQVDGVWHNADPWPREQADPALEALKILCGLNPQERQKRQTGQFAAEYLKEKYNATLTSQGTAAGERVAIQMEGKKAKFETLESLGMRQKMEEQLRELMRAERGIILFSAMPANGLRSTLTVALRTTDRFMREFVSVEDENNRYEVVENVPVTTFNGQKGESPATVLTEVFHKEPNVVVVRDLVNAETVSKLCEEIRRDRLFFTSIRAKDSAEALLRVLAMKVPAKELAEHVIAVVNQRLIRKLCEYCKEAYAPPAQVLQQLGIPEGKIQAFYRPRQPTEENPEICPECGGIGYTGRTAIFELLVVNQTVRKALTTNPKLEILRQAARKDGLKTFQEEGLVLVAKGVTSLPELMRVLKQ